MAVVAQVGELIRPLREDAQCILQECDNDKETTDGRKVPRWRNKAWSASKRDGETGGSYGLRGSPNESRISSILLVCLRIASSGLGSLVASGLLGPPKLFWAPRW